MSIAQKRSHDLRIGIKRVLILLVLGMGVTVSVAPQERTLPNVVNASVPFFPRTPQAAHIEGTVRLRISTDGSRVSSIEVESGQPMLVEAAKENVKTWQFEQHSPTTFETTFQYKLLSSTCDPECNCDSVEKSSVLLQLPSNVEVRAKEIRVCDGPAQGKN